MIKANARPALDTNLAPFFAGEGSQITELTSLRLKGVPLELNNRHFLRGYYLQFGPVKRVLSLPASNSAVVTFFEHVGYFTYLVNATYFNFIILSNFIEYFISSYNFTFCL